MFGGNDQSTAFNELRSLYSIYNWELGFHAPTILIDRLFKAQQYDAALKVCHYVFNPTNPAGPSDTTHPTARFWTFAPFKRIVQIPLEVAMNSDKMVDDWETNAFQPHVVPRDRPQSYMKYIVMTYIRILIAYGDSLFMQNTLEANNMAVQYYVSHNDEPESRQLYMSARRLFANMAALYPCIGS